MNYDTYGPSSSGRGFRDDYRSTVEAEACLTQSVADLRRQILDLTEEQRRLSRSMPPGGGGGVTGGTAAFDYFEDEELAGGRILLLSQIPDHLQNPDSIYFMMENFGRVEKVKILNKKRHVALVQMSHPGEASRALREFEALSDRSGHEMRIIESTNVSAINMPKPGADFAEGTKDFTGDETECSYPPNHLFFNRYPEEEDYDYEGNGGGDSYPNEPRNGNVVLVSNLPERLVNLDYLCNLFGQYGDVARIKIPVNKRDCALIQYTKPHYSQNGKKFLDEVEVEGKKLCVSYSRMRRLKSGSLDSKDLNKDFSESTSLHRFKNKIRALRLQKNLCSPTATIHVSNIDETLTNNEIRDYFMDKGFTVKDIFDSGSRKGMAVIRLANDKEGLMALATCHGDTEGLKTKKSLGLCISFSKRTK